MKHINTGTCVLQLAKYFEDETPLKAYEKIKWGFEALHNAPFKFNNVSEVILNSDPRSDNININMKNTSVNKLIKMLNKISYTSYTIIMKDGAYFKHLLTGESSNKRENIPEDVINLLHLFSED